MVIVVGVGCVSGDGNVGNQVINEEDVPACVRMRGGEREQLVDAKFKGNSNGSFTVSWEERDVFHRAHAQPSRVLFTLLIPAAQ